MKFVRDLATVSKNDVELVGGKAASLGEMLQQNMPVPAGYVVTTEAFTVFLEEAELAANIVEKIVSVNRDEVSAINEISKEVQTLIRKSALPEALLVELREIVKTLDGRDVAVRSSATAEDSKKAAWAGQLETFLHVTSGDLEKRVRDCFASLYSPRAIAYLLGQELNVADVAVAVVIQEMLSSEKSGIAFSVHPVSENKSEMIIEAGYGLGEAIVSGQVTPDQYVITKDPFAVVVTTVSKQTRALYRGENGGVAWKELGAAGAEQVLTESEILELSKLILQIEQHYGFPCDIEWAFVDGQFFITQSRPITTL